MMKERLLEVSKMMIGHDYKLIMQLIVKFLNLVVVVQHQQQQQQQQQQLDDIEERDQTCSSSSSIKLDDIEEDRDLQARQIQIQQHWESRQAGRQEASQLIDLVTDKK